MLIKLNRNTSKWLTLMFAASFLVNVQASYACDMMPDMEEQKAECCCGTSHKSKIPSAESKAQSHVGHTGIDTSQDQSCANPHIGCCVANISVGVNDPPDSDKAAVARIAKTQSHQIFQQLEHPPLFLEIKVFVAPFQILNAELTTIRPNTHRQLIPPPLFKTTERYRI